MKIFNRKQRRAALSALAIVPLALIATGCTTTQTQETTEEGPANVAGGEPLSIEELCGTEPIRIAHVAGFGGNTWRQIAEAEVADELGQCDNVTYEYAQADGDLQTYISLINSYSAQGFDGIVTYVDFGDQALSALRNAFEAGTVVVPYIGIPETGEVGVDYNGYARYDFEGEGAIMANWIAENSEDGATVIFTGGLEGGSPSSVALYDALKAENEALGEPFTVLNDQPIPSNWDPAYMQRAMTGILAEYPDFDVWVSDYGAADLGGLRALVQAGVEVPTLVTSATDNALGCFWLENNDPASPSFEMMTMDGTHSTARVAVRKTLAAVNGLPDNEPERVELFKFIDTVAGDLPTCRDDLPPDADLSSSLSEDQLKAVFN